MASAGSRAGSREVSGLLDEISNKWETYQRMSTEYESMNNERTPIYEAAGAETRPDERARLYDSVNQLEARMAENRQARTEIVTFLDEHLEDAIRAARAIRGERRDEMVSKMEEIQMAVFFIRQDQEQMQRDLSLAVQDLRMQAQPQRQATTAQPSGETVSTESISGTPQFTPEYSTSYRTVMRWYNKLLELEEDNAVHMRRLERDIRDGNTRSESHQRKGIDENIAEMIQLMANISRSLSDAMVEAGENHRHTEAFNGILETWNERQQKLLDAMAARGEPPQERIATYNAARYLCMNSMDDVLSMLVGAPYSVAYGPMGSVAPQAPTTVSRLPQPVPVPPQTAVVPVQQAAAGGPLEVPEGETYFEYLNQRTGRRYRISIDGQDLSGMSTEEVYALVQGYTTNAAKFRKLHVERVSERGVLHPYTSRTHVRDNFFAQQLGWTPGAQVLAPPVAPAAQAVPTAAPTAMPTEQAHNPTWAQGTYASIINRLVRLRDEFTPERQQAIDEGREYERQGEMDQLIAGIVRDYRALRNEVRGIRDAVQQNLERTGVGSGTLDQMNLIVSGILRLGRRIEEQTEMTAQELIAFAEAHPAGAPAAPAAPAAPVVAERQVAPPRAPAAPAAPVEAAPVPTTVEELRAARDEATRRVLENLAGANAVLLATRFHLVDTGQATQLQRFLRGEGTVLSVSATTPEAAGDLLRYISIAAGLRGIPADFGIAEPAEGRNYYTVYYRRVSQTEQTRRDAVANQNPMGLINLDSRMPVDTSPYNGFVDDFNSRYPDMAISFQGFAQNSDQLAADPESQAIAYGAQTATTLAGWRFSIRGGLTNGVEFMADTMYGRTGAVQHQYEIETNEAGQPMLSLEETAMFAAGFFTANTGRAMVTMQGVENVEGIDVNIFNANIEAARDHVGTTTYLGQGEAARRGISSVEYGKYAGSAYQRMRMILEDPALYDQMLATLPPDQRAGLEAGAELLGRFMYEIRRGRLGEPDDPAATLAACVDAARRIIVAKGYAENGELAFTFFTYGEREYMLGTNMITTHDFARWKPQGGWNFADPEFQRRHGNEGFYNLVFVPTETPGQVLVVGVIDSNDNLQLLSEPVQYALDWRDSVGLAGFTRRWCHNLPLINVGQFPIDYEDVGAPPPVGIPVYSQDPAPPTLAATGWRVGYAVPQLSGVLEHYTRGEQLDEAEYTVASPILYNQDRTERGPISIDEFLGNRHTYVETAMLRMPNPSQDVYYATLPTPAETDYADVTQGEIVQTAEFNNGRIYVYVDTTTHKIVMQLTPAGGRPRATMWSAYS
ncbi:hypothetical protein H0O01_04345 [Candidatus Micrarchaeota archaeon]|nr:hypothetical protein [Candidatus Micrarchaeota archaeon]